MNLQMELKNFLDDKGRLKLYPSKRKMKTLALVYLASKFKDGVVYQEKEINEILSEFHTFNDVCILRRELYQYKFLNRTQDCKKYWKEEQQPLIEEYFNN